MTSLDQRLLFGEEVGNPLAASLGTSALVVVKFDVVFTGNELSAFQSWLQTDLALGAESFDGLEGVVGDNAARYKFRTMPVFNVFRGGSAGQRLWRASFELLKL